jgi:predicted amidohydrolase
MSRKIRVVTTCQSGRGPSIEQNRERVMNLLDLACGQRPDIVCLPEAFATAGVGGPIAEQAETVPGPTTDACAKRAREHRTYVVCPLVTARGGRCYNSAVFLDRSGQVCGIYDKVHPVTSTADFTAAEHGTTPGSEAPVFEFDFGNVGCQICFDIGYPETWQQLADRGAELVFWPSAYNGGFPLRAYAYLHSYYVVSSSRTSHSRIISPLGEVLADTTGDPPLARREIDLDTIVCHTDFHGRVARELLAAYGDAVTVRRLGEEGRLLVQSNRDDLPLARLIEEHGLEDVRTYHKRHHPAYEAIRAGRTPEPQRPPYLERQQYA